MPKVTKQVTGTCMGSKPQSPDPEAGLIPQVPGELVLTPGRAARAREVGSFTSAGCSLFPESAAGDIYRSQATVPPLWPCRSQRCPFSISIQVLAFLLAATTASQSPGSLCLHSASTFIPASIISLSESEPSLGPHTQLS